MSISTHFSLERQKLGCPPDSNSTGFCPRTIGLVPGKILPIISMNPYLSKARPANFDRARKTRGHPHAAARACLCAEMAKEVFWANLAHSRKDRTQVFSIRVGESP